MFYALVKINWEFNFRPGEVTLYAGSNGGGKSLITGQIALGLIKQGRKGLYYVV
jgi:archaellum biogenesis ATPase FlaH